MEAGFVAVEEVDLPTPGVLPVGADASPQIAFLLGKRELPNEPNPISEHKLAQVPSGPDVLKPTSPPDFGFSDLPMLNLG